MDRLDGVGRFLSTASRRPFRWRRTVPLDGIVQGGTTPSNNRTPPRLPIGKQTGRLINDSSGNHKRKQYYL